MKKAKGTWTTSDNRRISITFEPELFKYIAEEAVKNRRSFNQQIRIYIAKGMRR